MRAHFNRRWVCSTKSFARTRNMASATHSGPRRFAPVNSSLETKHDAPKVKGLVFDMDGTLCLPQNYMFKEIRAALNIEKPTDILDHVLSLSEEPDSEGEPSSSPRSRAQDAIKKIELEAMHNQKPQPGLDTLITYLAKKNIHSALCTRNFEQPVKHLLQNFVSEEGRARFSPLITREAKGIHPKPSPAGIWACVHAWDSSIADEIKARDAFLEYDKKTSDEEKIKTCVGVLMVGDSIDDIEAGARAGAATVLLVNDENKHLLEESKWPKKVDLGINRLDELVDVLENGFQGRD